MSNRESVWRATPRWAAAAVTLNSSGSRHVFLRWRCGTSEIARASLIHYHDIMNYDHELKKNRAKRVRQPVQVYLDAPEQERLERLTEEMDTTKSDILRRGLKALARELFDPEHHPALQIIGIADVDQGRDCDFDVAREHDRYLADLEERRLPKKRSGGG